MKVVRFSVDGLPRYGVLENDTTIQEYRGDPFPYTGGRDFAPAFGKYDLSEVKLLVPCQPTKVIGLGLNYMPHIDEIGFKKPEAPVLFLKPLTSVIGPDDYILKPDVPGRVDYEGEVGVVIGRCAKNVSVERAMDFVLGFTCVNDVSSRYCQDLDRQWTRGKGFDTFCPIGPYIDTEGDPENIKVETYVNGELRQSGNTKDLIFNIRYIISFLSQVMTLLPGDVIATGTPAGIGELNDGDTVEVKVGSSGTLRNFVKNR